MIAVVDYGMGNLRSVEKGLLHVGADARVVTDAQSIDNARGIVLPGVGAFRDCMQNLADQGLIDAIKRNIAKGKPFFGICLGLQVLFSESGEFGHSKGLDVFKGTVPRFPESDLKVPHMGWNAIKVQKPGNPLLKDVEDGSFVYFVHSYYVAPEDKSIVATTTDYGIEFTSMIWDGNLFATQFHPEKSQDIGLQILKNFSDFVQKA